MSKRLNRISKYSSSERDIVFREFQYLYFSIRNRSVAYNSVERSELVSSYYSGIQAAFSEVLSLVYDRMSDFVECSDLPF